MDVETLTPDAEESAMRDLGNVVLPADRYFDEDSWTKIALTEEQVEADPRLLGLKIDKLDRRNKPPKSYEAVECEAVGQAQLQEIFRAALDARLPDRIESVLARERRQRSALERARARS